jgi:four helix bundle protein
MLRIYWVMLDAIERMQPLVDTIRAHNRKLAGQLEEASDSVPLNIAEGSGNRGGTRRARYNTALGSARETVSYLQVAERRRFIPTLPEDLIAMLNHVIAVLVIVTR